MTPDRFFSLLLALQTREAVTAADLAEQTGVSVRTVLRDLRWLQEAGFPVLVERGRWGGVRLLPGGALDTSRLTPAERDHLVLHGLDDEQRHQLGAGTESRRARAKLAARRQPTASRLPISAVVVTDNSPWFGRDAEGADPSAVVGDVRRGVRLRIRYRRSEDTEPTWQVVDPYGLLAKAGRWYLVADRRAVPRLYALERLVDWRPMRAPAPTAPRNDPRRRGGGTDLALADRRRRPGARTARRPPTRPRPTHPRLPHDRALPHGRGGRDHGGVPGDGGRTPTAALRRRPDRDRSPRSP
ncbi:helix-turn-helix transcriptional regulator [Streptomyces sudanensis]|uniref:helix-turn-helix transcriptional regulator n=1 Tax=Streptomyces sudanensis TaxID=436397 RepID=UPI003FD87ADF